MAMTGRKLARWLNLGVAALLAFAIWGLATVFAAQPELKLLWDVSPQARFTVEPATAELLAQMRARGQSVEMHMVFYPTGALRPEDALGRRRVEILRGLQDLTRDLLRQYDYLGGDAVTVSEYDLMRDPAKLRDVMKQVQSAEWNTVVLKMGGRSKVLSLEMDMAELDLPRSTTPQGMPSAEALPSLKDYKGEEAISTALKLLLEQGTPKIYFLSDSTMVVAGIARSYSELLGALEADGFEVAWLDLTRAGSIPEDADVVALIDPRYEMPPRTAELLYHWVRGGGRLFVNLQHWSGDAGDWNVSLRELGTRFGFALSPQLILHGLQDPQNPRQMLMGDQECQNLVVFNLNPTHPVTRPLQAQRRYPVFKVGREITAVQGEELDGIRVDPSLLRTGPGAWLEEEPVDFQGPPEREAYQPRSIGAVIDVDARDGGRSGHVVVISAAGFDNYGFQYNGDLALNVFNWLAEREALVSIRGKKYVARRLELEPQRLDRIGWLLMAGVPGFLLVLGLGVFWRRRRA